ncbi:MAG TPA: MFS transporter [Firmicutes bacterium]|nr:MFS transporter [Bacillota bacterium]
MSTDAASPGHIALFLAANILYWSALYLYVPILSPYAEQLGGSLTIAGLVVASYGLLQFLLRIPIGIWSDRLGRRRPFLLAGMLTAGAAGVGLYLAGGPAGLLFSRGLAGVSASMWVPISVLFSSYFPRRRTAYAMGLITMVMTASQLGAMLAGGLVAEKTGWHGPFLGAALLGVAGFLLSLFVKEKGQKKAGLNGREILLAATEPSFLAICLLGACYQFIMFSTTYGFTTNFAVTLGAGKAELGYLMVAASLPAAVASYFSGGWLAVRLGEAKAVVLGFAVTSLATFLIPLCPTMNALYITQAVGGLSRGVIFPILMGLAIKNAPEERRATAMGFFQSLYAIGMFAGPAISGAVGSAAGLAIIFLMSGVLGLAAMVYAALRLSVERSPADYIKRSW